MIFSLFKQQRKQRERITTGTLKPYDRRKIEEEWGRVEQLIQLGKPSAFKEAVIVADKLMDYALTQISYGETMGERLKNARGAFPPSVYQDLWRAHKVRNALVHDPDYDLTQLVARDALRGFEAALQAVGVKL